MKLFVYAELDEADAACLGDALAAPGDLADLAAKLAPMTIPALPMTALVLRGGGETHRAIILLDGGDEPNRAALRDALERRIFARYGQELVAVPFEAVRSVAGLQRLVRQANGDDDA